MNRLKKITLIVMLPLLISSCTTGKKNQLMRNRSESLKVSHTTNGTETTKTSEAVSKEVVTLYKDDLDKLMKSLLED